MPKQVQLNLDASNKPIDIGTSKTEDNKNTNPNSIGALERPTFLKGTDLDLLQKFKDNNTSFTYKDTKYEPLSRIGIIKALMQKFPNDVDWKKDISDIATKVDKDKQYEVLGDYLDRIITKARIDKHNNELADSVGASSIKDVGDITLALDNMETGSKRVFNDIKLAGYSIADYFGADVEKNLKEIKSKDNNYKAISDSINKNVDDKGILSPYNATQVGVAIAAAIPTGGESILGTALADLTVSYVNARGNGDSKLKAGVWAVGGATLGAIAGAIGKSISGKKAEETYDYFHNLVFKSDQSKELEKEFTNDFLPTAENTLDYTTKKVHSSNLPATKREEYAKFKLKTLGEFLAKNDEPHLKSLVGKIRSDNVPVVDAIRDSKNSVLNEAKKAKIGDISKVTNDVVDATNIAKDKANKAYEDLYKEAEGKKIIDIADYNDKKATLTEQLDNKSLEKDMADRMFVPMATRIKEAAVSSDDAVISKAIRDLDILKDSKGTNRDSSILAGFLKGELSSRLGTGNKTPIEITKEELDKLKLPKELEALNKGLEEGTANPIKVIKEEISKGTVTGMLKAHKNVNKALNSLQSDANKDSARLLTNVKSGIEDIVKKEYPDLYDKWVKTRELYGDTTNSIHTNILDNLTKASKGEIPLSQAMNGIEKDDNGIIQFSKIEKSLGKEASRKLEALTIQDSLKTMTNKDDVINLVKQMDKFDYVSPYMKVFKSTLKDLDKVTGHITKAVTLTDKEGHTVRSRLEPVNFIADRLKVLAGKLHLGQNNIKYVKDKEFADKIMQVTTTIKNGLDKFKDK